MIERIAQSPERVPYISQSSLFTPYDQEAAPFGSALHVKISRSMMAIRDSDMGKAC
jgi:hypothetical protein